MEEDQELKHVCKSCSKSFPCGRSLGGHMRSHITNNSAESEGKLATRKLSSSVINGGSKINEAGANTGYGLRENRKKTWRVSDLSEGTLLLDKFCQECGKGFHSWKALFGHMKCHSQKERVCNSLEDQDSWTDATQKQVLDSQSDNEAGAPNRRRRSKRRTRYMAAATTSSLSFANPSSSVSEVEQEQEEVAISLMMLSRDLGSWGGSVAENSDNSGNFEARSSVRTNLVSKIEGKKMPISNGSEKAKLTNRSDQKWEISNVDSSKGKKSELLSSEFPRNGFRINGLIENDKAKKRELNFQSVLEDSKDEQGKNEVNGTEIASIKRKFFGSELKSNFSKNLGKKLPEAEFSKNFHKRGKFECTTCNKIFSSYQALGGHRASHKKTKGCFASRSENSIETDLSPDVTTESKIIKNNEYEHELSSGFDHEAEIFAESKKSKGHKCPICLKIFSSGQALGGHKRSHLGGGSESRKDQTVQEIRDFLDLNLPAATEEESRGHSESYRPWWVRGSGHKQEALVGLVSN